MLIEVKELTHLNRSLLILRYGSKVWVELLNLFILWIDGPHGRVVLLGKNKPSFDIRHKRSISDLLLICSSLHLGNQFILIQVKNIIEKL